MAQEVVFYTRCGQSAILNQISTKIENMSIGSPDILVKDRQTNQQTNRRRRKQYLPPEGSRAITTTVSFHIKFVSPVGFLRNNNDFSKLHTDSADDGLRQDFLQEIELMKSIGCHGNLVNMLGCCIHTPGSPLCLIVEHMSGGDLLHFLRNHRVYTQLKQVKSNM